MAKKRKRISPEARAELDASYEHTTRLLEERIAYHRRKLAEEREEREHRRRSWWRRFSAAR